MVSERQKYLSAFLKNIGYALFTPMASIIFQWLAFNRSLFTGHLYSSSTLFLTGWIFIIYGYIILKEK